MVGTKGQEMTAEQAKAQIDDAIIKYDEGALSLTALHITVRETCEELAKTSFLAGQAYEDDDGEEYEIEIIDDED